MMLLWYLIEKFVLKIGFEKGVFLANFHFTYLASSYQEIPGTGLQDFYHQASSLIGN